MCAISTRWIPPFSRPSVAKAQMNLQCFSTLSHGLHLLSEMLTKSFFRLLASERWRKVVYSIDYSFLPSSLPLKYPLFVHSPKHVFQAFYGLLNRHLCIYHEDSKQVSAWLKVFESGVRVVGSWTWGIFVIPCNLSWPLLSAYKISYRYCHNIILYLQSAWTYFVKSLLTHYLRRAMTGNPCN
jgi:hypothetical protein